MATIITTTPAEVITEQEIGFELAGGADNMLLAAVKQNKVAKVPAGQARVNRAWSRGGNVD